MRSHSSRKAGEGEAEFSREIEIGHIKAGPHQVDERIEHGTDCSSRIARERVDHSVRRSRSGGDLTRRRAALNERRKGADSSGSEARRLGEIDAKAVAAALIAAGHFGGGVAEVLLHIALVDLGGRGEASAQRMPRECLLPLALGQVAANASRERGTFDQPGDVPVGQPLGADLAADDRRNTGPRSMRPNFSQVSSATTGQVASEEPRPISTSRQPVFPRSVSSSPSSKNSSQPPLRPSSGGSRGRRFPSASGRRRSRRGGSRGRAGRVGSPRAQGRDHGQQVFWQDRLLLVGRPAMGAPDAGEHGRDMAVLAVSARPAPFWTNPAAPRCGVARSDERGTTWWRGIGFRVAGSPGADGR